jgi:hypothetical protein
MPNHRLFPVVAAAIIVVLAGVWYVKRGGQAPAAIDLVQRLPDALKQQDAEAGSDAFAVRDERVGGQTMRAIYAHPTTRITWRVITPTDAWLKTHLGVDERAWSQEGDGVLFMIGVRALDGGTYRELLRQVVDPHTRDGDRRWLPVTLDLSPYSGRTIEIYFNTRVGLKGNDARNDFAYWGAPGIYLTR